nr:hypothetical protein [Sphingomonas laterariae]
MNDFHHAEIYADREGGYDLVSVAPGLLAGWNEHRKDRDVGYLTVIDGK